MKPKTERKPSYRIDPMNPAHGSDKPGKTPDGVDLMPVYADSGRVSRITWEEVRERLMRISRG